jgi:hypothetical protein
MHYKLIGFSQNDSVRRYQFERILGNGATSAAFGVFADVAVARKLRITLQELPSLCARLLESRAEDQPAGDVFLTDADLQVHAAANLSVAKQEQAKRALRSRRGALAAAARTDKNTAQPSSPEVAS